MIIGFQVNMKTRHSTIFILAAVTLMITISVPVVNAEITEDIVSPKKQVMAGVDMHEIQCREGYELVLKSGELSPVCCKSSSVEKLIQRGWAMDYIVRLSNSTNSHFSNVNNEDTIAQKAQAILKHNLEKELKKRKMI
mgnify:CR=1 FL=1